MSSHMKYISCLLFSSCGWNATSAVGNAKISYPSPASTERNPNISLKNFRSASASFEQTTMCAPVSTKHLPPRVYTLGLRRWALRATSPVFRQVGTYAKRLCRAQRFSISTSSVGPSAVVIPAIDLVTDDREIAPRRIQWIGLPRKTNGWHLNRGLHLARRSGSSESEMFAGVLILHGFTVSFPDHLKGHSRRCSYGVQRRPLRLINHGHVFHLER